MTTELTVPGDLAHKQLVQEFLDESLQSTSFAEHQLFSIKLAVEEFLVEAVRYGNQSDPDKRLFVVIDLTPKRFEIRITDEGSGATRTVSRPLPA